MSDETDAEIYDSLIDLYFEFDEKRFISLTEIAESCGMSPLSYLRKAIRNRKSVFARLRGTGAIITGKKLGDYHKISLQFQLWYLSYDNLKKMLFNKPPWEITSLYRPDVIYGKSDVQFTYYPPEPIDENDLFLEIADFSSSAEVSPSRPFPTNQGGAVTSSPTVPKNNFFADKKFHKLVLRSIDDVYKTTKDLNWNKIWKGLKKNTVEGETIQFVDDFDEQGDQILSVHYKQHSYMKPYKIKESYFKKRLSDYRKAFKK